MSTMDQNFSSVNKIVCIQGDALSLEDVLGIANGETKAALTTEPSILSKVRASERLINDLIQRGEVIYGVTTNFGGLANTYINLEEASELQSHQVWGLKCGIGKQLDDRHVLAAMLLRANALMKGASGIRLEIIERYCKCINENVIPIVYEHGSIGASGDLVPLAHIAGAVIGLGNAFQVRFKGRLCGAVDALAELQLQPIKLQPKEGLAMVNGTSVSNAVAINSLGAMKELFLIALHIHAMIIITLNGSLDSFHDFIHQTKPHPGQIAVARMMYNLLTQDGRPIYLPKATKQQGLVQDRYSIRCLPQFLGVIHEGIERIQNTLLIEANSASDNPLLDCETGRSFSGGNFLAQHVAVAMDEVRQYIALLTKHLDAQISLLVSPEFNKGLPASLEGNRIGNIKYGLKGIQIAMNSLMSMLVWYGNGFSHLFATHCEQFNQNINSLSFGSANLAWESVQILKQYLAMALIVAVQGVELRAYEEFQTYDARQLLPHPLRSIYENVYSVLARSDPREGPLVLNFQQYPLDATIQKILEALPTLRDRSAPW